MVDLLTRAANLLVFFARVNLCGLCLLIFIVILVCFSCFLPPFLLKQLWAFISLEPLEPLLCCKPSPNLRSPLFYSLAPLSFASLGWRCCSSTMGSCSSSSLLAGFSALASSIIMGPFGCPCLWWLSPASFMEVMMVFCSLHVDSCEVALLWCVEVFPCV